VRGIFNINEMECRSWFTLLVNPNSLGTSFVAIIVVTLSALLFKMVISFLIIPSSDVHIDMLVIHVTDKASNNCNLIFII